MKLENGKLSVSENEAEFRKKLERVLQDWFDLCLWDLKEIIPKLAKEENETYQIQYVSDDTLNLRFKVIGEREGKQEEFDVELFRGDMTCPYSMCFVYRDGERENYSITRVIHVDNLTISGQQFNNKKAKKAYEKLMKEE